MLETYLGIAPIAWSNDDLPELGGETTLETCLAEARKARFSGIETGGKFPMSVEELRPLLTKHKLALCGGWYSGTLLDTDIEAEKDKVAKQLELFRALNAPCLVYGETAGSLQSHRNTPLSHRRILSDDEIKVYGHKLTSFAEWCADSGMPISFHHHMATAIESERDTDLLMTHSGEALQLLLDPGHMTFAGGDSLRIIDRHGHRISHFHAKDIRLPVLKGLNRSSDSFLDAVLKGVFTVPGDGDIDFTTLTKRMADIGYQGWFVIEAEQDPATAPPYEYACKGHASISLALTKAGYTIKEKTDE